MKTQWFSHLPEIGLPLCESAQVFFSSVLLLCLYNGVNREPGTSNETPPPPTRKKAAGEKLVNPLVCRVELTRWIGLESHSRVIRSETHARVVYSQSRKSADSFCGRENE